jgi:hypothetical protein
VFASAIDYLPVVACLASPGPVLASAKFAVGVEYPANPVSLAWDFGVPANFGVAVAAARWDATNGKMRAPPANLAFWRFLVGSLTFVKFAANHPTNCRVKIARKIA